MSLILKQEPANTIATPPAGKTTLFVTETNTMATKGPDGNVTQFPTVQGSNTQVLFNDDGAINGDSSFTFNKSSDLVTVANLTVSGTLTAGDIAVSSIANGTSNVDIVGVSGNVTISVDGNANILTVTGTGANIAGTLNATGNANVGNLGTAGLVVATGNVTGGNITTAGQVVSSIATGTAPLVVTSTTQVANLNAATAGLATYATTANAVAGANVSGTVSSATTAGTVTTAAQPNITSVGTLSSLTATGNVTGGNLNTSGNVNSSIMVNGDTGLYLSAGPSGYINFFTTGGDKATISDSGNMVATNLIANSTVFAVTANVSGNVNAGNIVTGGIVSATGNVSGGNLTTGGVVAATGNVTGGNLVTSGSANIGGGMTISAGGANITGVTNFTGNLNITGNINATGNLNYSNVTDLVVGDPLIYLGANNTGNLYDLGFVASYNDGSYVHTGIARNHNNGVWTFFDGVAAEPTTVIDWANATYPAVKVGSLSSTTTISVTGNANVGNLGTSGLVVATGNVTGGNLVTGGVLSVTGNANVGNLGTSGLVVATGNVTGGNLVTSGVLSVTGNANVGNLGTAGIIVSSIATGTAPLTVASTTRVSNLNVATAGAADTATTAGTVTTAAQPNITSVGTLSSLTLSGTLTGAVQIGTGAATHYGTTLTTGANTTAGTITGNWSLSAGSKLNATYADLAEKYVADAEYDPGTVLQFGGEHEVTISSELSTTRVAGVVTTNPAYTMNNECEGEHVATLALQGRVPCKVIGPIRKGDLLVSAGNGHAIANNEARAGTIIGKALGNFTEVSGVIEVAVGRF